MIKFSEYISNGGPYCSIDIDSVPFHAQRDYVIRNENVKNGKPLCLRCNGTGNELFSMYRKCTVYKGNGISIN